MQPSPKPTVSPRTSPVARSDSNFNNPSFRSSLGHWKGGGLPLPPPPQFAATTTTTTTSFSSLPQELAAPLKPSRRERAVWSFHCRRLFHFLVLCFRDIRSALLDFVESMQNNESASSQRSDRVMTSRTFFPLDDRVAREHVDNTTVNSRYTALNFVFKNLFEQFSRPLNFYFLLVVMLQFFSVIAPVSPMSTFLPLLFAFTLTAVKEGYDDVKRHRQDALYNNKLRLVYSDRAGGSWQRKRNADIRVGDVILVREDEDIPCDMVVFAAQSHQHRPTRVVFVRTDNLDGEIDLKPREVIQFDHLPQDEDGRASDADAEGAAEDVLLRVKVPPYLRHTELFCPAPNAIVDAFDACAKWRPADASAPQEHEQLVSLTHEHLLLQSCTLRKVCYAVGVAVYTGSETKCGMNKQEAPTKWAQVDKVVSRYSVYIFICQVMFTFLFGCVGYAKNKNISKTFWYLQEPHQERGLAAFFIYPLRFFLLTTVMIPVSFKFVVDTSKYYMSKTVEWDATMMNEAGEGCKVNNSAILEDLGQVDYVLSDKTGTMTQNVMRLANVSVCPAFARLEIPADDAGDAEAERQERVSTPPPEEAKATAMTQPLLRALCLCNTVEVLEDGRMEAASPDELALCHGAAALGAKLTARTRDVATLTFDGGQVERWKVHHVFPFSSEKKSMSVIVEEEREGVVRLLVKGADDRVRRMLRPCSSDHEAQMKEELRCYSKAGLRTLLIGERVISQTELAAVTQQLVEAQRAMDNRAARVDAIRTTVETNVELLGVTAIEDKLQDGVQKTISDFLAAGVRVWMLTGDKVETAEQIGLSCSLYNYADTLVRLLDDGETDWRETLGTANNTVLSSRTGGNGGRIVVVVQGGHVLREILSTPFLAQCFSQLTERAVSVICARTTPMQKADVTKFVKDKGFLTLAVGDGGNDVEMIHTAHVGIGIVGKEGQQAARAADFAVWQFSHLRPLLFVHGQQAYLRTSYIIKYSFYKSMLISFIQVAYNVVGTYYSGGTFWNSFGLTMWNGCYTLPQTFLYCLDRAAPRTVLEENPALYRLTRTNAEMKPAEFFLNYVARGVLQSCLVLYLVLQFFNASYASTQTASAATHDVDFSVAYTSLILSQIVCVYTESHTVTVHNLVWLLGMPAAYFVSTYMYSDVAKLQYYGVFARSLSVENVLASIVFAAWLVVPVLICRWLRHLYFPNPRDVLAEREKKRIQKLVLAKPRSRPANLLERLLRTFVPLPELHSSYQPSNALPNEVPVDVALREVAAV